VRDILILLSGLATAKSRGTSDLPLTAGNSPPIRVDSALMRIDNLTPLTDEEVMKAFM